MPTSYIAWYNGKIQTEDRIQISCNDRGLLYGDGLFETMRSINHKIIAFSAHMERLHAACNETRMPFDRTPTDLRYAIAELLRKNEMPDAHIRLTVTRGIADRFGYGFSTDLKPNWLLQVRLAKPVPAKIYLDGVKISIQLSTRFHPVKAKLQVKSLSGMDYALAKQHALEEDSYETLLLDADANIYEATSSNVFIILDGILVTPPVASGILPGITRARVLELATSRLQLKTEERVISKEDFVRADEVFLTNTNIDVLPVTRLGTRKIGTGSIGVMTKQLLTLFRETLPEILE